MPVMFFLFIFLPIVELAVLIKIGSIIGVLPTISILILSAASGIILLKQNGVRSLLKIYQKLKLGKTPAKEALESLIISTCCILLILPGFITDIVALCGLTPCIRHWSMHFFIKTANNKKSDNIIEGEYTSGSDDRSHLHHFDIKEEKEERNMNKDKKNDNNLN